MNFVLFSRDIDFFFLHAFSLLSYQQHQHQAVHFLVSSAPPNEVTWVAFAYSYLHEYRYHHSFIAVSAFCRIIHRCSMGVRKRATFRFFHSFFYLFDLSNFIWHRHNRCYGPDQTKTLPCTKHPSHAYTHEHTPQHCWERPTNKCTEKSMRAADIYLPAIEK